MCKNSEIPQNPRVLILSCSSINPLTIPAKVPSSRRHPTQHNEPKRKPLLQPTRSLILVSPTSGDAANLPRTAPVRHSRVGLAPRHQVLRLLLRREEWRPCHVCRRIQHPRRPHDRFSPAQPDRGIAGQDPDICRGGKSLDRRIQQIGGAAARSDRGPGCRYRRGGFDTGRYATRKE